MPSSSTSFFIVIDPAGEVSQVVERAAAGIAVVSVSSVAAAKRKLIEAAPLLLISRATFSDDPDGGYRLGRELQSHAALSGIPLLLVESDIDEASLRKATECGAKALIPWPVSAESLQVRLSSLLPSIKFAEVKAEAARSEPPKVADAPAAKSSEQPSPGQGAVAARPVVQSEKLQLAQQLLARVLHSLRTSDLLEVADLEDVPAIVFQMTRTVCGMKDEARPGAGSQRGAPSGSNQAAASQSGGAPGAVPSGSGDITADLENAFRIKK